MGPLGAHVLHLTAEYWPYARTGGLGEAVRGLALYQGRAGIPVLAILPLYRSVKEGGANIEPAGDAFDVQVGPRRERGRLWTVSGQRAGEPRILFVEHEEYFDRPGIYGEAGADYPDNGRRFGFLAAAMVQQLPQLASGTPLIHAHDWHTALAPVYLRTVYRGRPEYDRAACVLSVHNAGFQGQFGPEVLPDLGLPAELFDWRWMEWHGRVNWLKGGLIFSEMAVTVSPSHAHELRTEIGGFGLHGVFIDMRDAFVGILNGIDTDRWNPATDPYIAANYTREDLSGKVLCKAALQRAYRLPERADVPLLGMTARLVAQKGLDLILGGRLLSREDTQVVFLGAGESRYETALDGIASQAPHRVVVDFAFSDEREHQLLAGADALLMPSLYEPCGLTQMRAQRYGALPVARRVGGLADTIVDEETGFLFDEYAPPALEVAVQRAIDLYRDREAWPAHMREAMSVEVGWAHAAEKYLPVYRRALAARAAGKTHS